MVKPTIKTYHIGDTIFEEGDPADALFVIRKGVVEVKSGDKVLDELGKNAIFGEMALIDSQPRSATATAKETTECAHISKMDFQKHLDSLDPVMKGIFRVMLERIRSLNQNW